ncbi:NADP-dependent succinate-semialdehyde dehydrogenase [Rhodovibrio salinarum]|uniref:Succinate-semialdehyde dehydrogenase I n=1 Tax=Rhodovibrio salinarum TaxID=1087 RepID=A0A934V0U9_9PROT|nr:NADP-dependent succinate-semialdehyde dehydrogenase [Rhodovibrio salinarum]MBK1698323.1 succinate-semialdehyde dehydrogenase I [Rhodovibrio salinarum]
MSPDASRPAAPQLQDAKLFRQQAYIDGQWADADSGERFEVTNPADGQVIGTAPSMAAGETRRAIEAADRAFADWRAKTAKERAQILRKWYDLIIAAQSDLAQLMTLEQGKPLTESMGEVVYGASFVEWFAEEAKRIYGDTIPPHQSDKRIVVTKEPIGVSAAITPWNFPIAMITRKCAPALAAGCPVVVKPAEQTPYCALALAELAERAGLPAGVFNVVTGDAEAVGGELTSNATVRKLSFTGSTAVGKLLMRQCADTVKKVSLELGGNAPFIVFEDADLDAAVEGAIGSKFRNTGQTCVCANRILVQDSIYEAFAAKMAEKVGEMKVGSGFDQGINLGPLIDEDGLKKVEDHVRDATSKGAKIAVGGARHELGGTFFQPTVLTDVTTDMKVTNEETFGPVAPLFRFGSEDEAVRMANDTPFGLAAYFYSQNLGRCWRVGAALEYGIVGINTGIISTEVAPFGGVKESGIGREGSKYGIEEYLEIKYMCMGGL